MCRWTKLHNLALLHDQHTEGAGVGMINLLKVPVSGWSVYWGSRCMISLLMEGPSVWPVCSGPSWCMIISLRVFSLCMVSPGKGPRVSTKQLHDMTYRLATDIALNNNNKKTTKNGPSFFQIWQYSWGSIWSKYTNSTRPVSYTHLTLPTMAVV